MSYVLYLPCMTTLLREAQRQKARSKAGMTRKERINGWKRKSFIDSQGLGARTKQRIVIDKNSFKNQNSNCFDAELKESIHSKWVEYIIEGVSGTKLADKLYWEQEEEDRWEKVQRSEENLGGTCRWARGCFWQAWCSGIMWELSQDE